MSKYRTPLRYPGGKQRLAPFIAELLTKNDLLGGDYVEPYAGGAGVAMELLINGMVSRVHLNDSSFPIFAFWSSIKSRPDDFCRRISRAALTVKEWRRQREIVRAPTEYDKFDVGFATFFLNRCNRSGVLNGGLIGGLSQTGRWNMDARFPRKELIQRIEVISTIAHKIRLKNMDAEDYIINYIKALPRKTFVYCDPPYFKKSSRLYLDHYLSEDHENIAKVIQTRLKRKWVVSYDGAKEITKFYSGRRRFFYDLQYSASRSYKGKEVFIFSDGLTIPHESLLPQIDVALKSNRKKLFARTNTKAAA